MDDVDSLRLHSKGSDTEEKKIHLSIVKSVQKFHSRKPVYLMMDKINQIL